MQKVTLGGERLGAGKKQEIALRNYERSTHDLSYLWRSTMSSGTLVPFLTEVALPGDTFDIDLNVDIKTHPTIGPLFGSYKVQLDVFQIPIRLYNARLHMNELGIGLKMADIKLPQLDVKAVSGSKGDNNQINPSALLSHLNIRGLGRDRTNATEVVRREFNAIPYLAYWDIYKNYYANKQEEIGAIIHNPMMSSEVQIDNIMIGTNQLGVYPGATGFNLQLTSGTTGSIQLIGGDGTEDLSDIFVYCFDGTNLQLNRPINEIFQTQVWDSGNEKWLLSNPDPWLISYVEEIFFQGYQLQGDWTNDIVTPKITTFPLKNIDDMRKDILVDVNNASSFLITSETYAPYGLPLQEGDLGYCNLASQEGLALKTYQSDLFNNWISTEWIDGDNGINSITAIDTSSGEFTIDTLMLSRKVYDMLNRIALSGGTYDDWLNAVYTHERTRGIENPMYLGGLIRELAFQEVVSNAESGEQPLGTLAGRGVLTQKEKGGKIYCKVDEPSYIMGIISLTPRVDYSQGNKWDTGLKTLDDLHKPALDEIGFQDLITEQMAWWDTEHSSGNIKQKSAGKQPAWINYMTNVNVCRGNFANENQQMFMTLNRRYEEGEDGILDLTTYIDPTKFNFIFADVSLDAQNFWAQIAVNMEVRRKMSARVMPNL